MKSAKSAATARAAPSAKRRSGDRRRATRKPCRKSPHPASDGCSPQGPQRSRCRACAAGPGPPRQACAPSPRLPLFFRTPGFAQPLEDALALLEVGRVVALGHAEKSGDRVIRREPRASFHLGLRLIETAEIREWG